VALVKNRISNPPSPNSGSSQAGFSTRAALEVFHRRIKGQPLVWNVTIVVTLADSYVLKTSKVSGFAAEIACKRKHSKYSYSSVISSNYIFKGLTFETLGPWCKEAIDFINVIGERLIAESGVVM
jgi:hypothetical protein